MKTRLSYVSNSSSSSYMIPDLGGLSRDVVDKIINYDEACRNYILSQADQRFDVSSRFGALFDGCRWDIEIDEENDRMLLFTDMDNFDMGTWLETLGVAFD